MNVEELIGYLEEIKTENGTNENIEIDILGQTFEFELVLKYPNTNFSQFVLKAVE